jgi:hypothetical protein
LHASSGADAGDSLGPMAVVALSAVVQ